MFKPLIIIAIFCASVYADSHTDPKTTAKKASTTESSKLDDQLKQFPIISDEAVFLPNANRYIFSVDKLLDNNNQYKPNAAKILNQFVPHAKSARIVNIYGFTSKALQGPIGIKTSTEQAQRIADYLWSQGVDLDKMNIRGMGFQEPRINASNDVEQNFFNHRIEIDLIQ